MAKDITIFSANDLPAHWPVNLVAASTRAGFGNGKELSIQKQFLDALDLRQHNLYTCQQTHSANVACVEKDSPLIFENTDGIFSLQNQTALGIYSADCMPVLIAARNGNFFGIVHAGWRGMAQKIVSAALKKMQQFYSISTQDFLIFSAPHIQDCCYQVGQDLYSAFAPDCFELKNQKLHLNLKTALTLQLKEFGLPAENYRAHSDCTFCAPNYHSFRRTKTQDRSLSIIAPR